MRIRVLILLTISFVLSLSVGCNNLLNENKENLRFLQNDDFVKSVVKVINIVYIIIIVLIVLDIVGIFILCCTKFINADDTCWVILVILFVPFPRILFVYCIKKCCPPIPSRVVVGQTTVVQGVQKTNFGSNNNQVNQFNQNAQNNFPTNNNVVVNPNGYNIPYSNLNQNNNNLNNQVNHSNNNQIGGGVNLGNYNLNSNNVLIHDKPTLQPPGVVYN